MMKTMLESKNNNTTKAGTASGDQDMEKRMKEFNDLMMGMQAIVNPKISKDNSAENSKDDQKDGFKVLKSAALEEHI